MKKPNKLNLSRLGKIELDKRKQSLILGGDKSTPEMLPECDVGCCECGCGPPNNDISSNITYNYDAGYCESSGSSHLCWCDGESCSAGSQTVRG